MSQAITVQDTDSTTATGQGSQSIISGTPTPGSVAQVGCAGAASAAHNVSGTWTGTLQFEASFDGGRTNVPVSAVIAGTGTIVETITENGSFIANVAGAQSARLRATDEMTGTANVDTITSQAPNVITSIAAA